MKNSFLCTAISSALLLAGVAFTPLVGATELTLKSGDTIAKQIGAQKGKKITIRLVSGEEITGTVKDSTAELVQLSELAGKEFFDAVIDIGKVSAIIVRTK